MPNLHAKRSTGIIHIQSSAYPVTALFSLAVFISLSALALSAWSPLAWILIAIPIASFLLFHHPLFFYFGIVSIQFNSIILTYARTGQPSPLALHFHEPIFLIIVFAWFANRTFGLIPPYKSTKYDIWIFLFTVLTGLSLLWSHDQIRGVSELQALLLALFFSFPVVLTTLTSRKRLDALMTLFIVCGLVNTILVFFSQYFPYPDFPTSPIYASGSFLLEFIFNLPNMGNRGHAFGHPLHTAAWLNVSILMCLLRVLNTTARRVRYAYAILGLLMLAALISTHSKGPLISLFATLIFLTWYLPKLRRRALTVTATALLALALAIVISAGPELTRLLTVTVHQLSGGDDLSSTSSRINWWGQSLHQAVESSFWGVGIGGITQYLHYPAPHPHNMYVATMAELGLVGLSLLIYTLARPVIDFSIHTQRLRLSEQATYPAVMMGAYLGSLVNGLTDYSYYFMYHWLFFGIFVAASRLYTRHDTGDSST